MRRGTGCDDSGTTARRSRPVGRLVAEFRWCSCGLEGGDLPEGLPRIVRKRAEELIALGCRKGDALAQAQGERHVRIEQRMRVIRRDGPFSFPALARAASEYPYESLGDAEGLRRRCLLAYCALLDHAKAKRALRLGLSRPGQEVPGHV